MNVDTKIIKHISKQMREHIEMIMHHDQVGSAHSNLYNTLYK